MHHGARKCHFARCTTCCDHEFQTASTLHAECCAHCMRQAQQSSCSQLQQANPHIDPAPPISTHPLPQLPEAMPHVTVPPPSSCGHLYSDSIGPDWKQIAEAKEKLTVKCSLHKFERYKLKTNHHRAITIVIYFEVCLSLFAVIWSLILHCRNTSSHAACHIYLTHSQTSCLLQLPNLSPTSISLQLTIY